VKANISTPTASPFIRNVAIIAHVDHGKTTLVDGLLRSTGVTYDEDRLMDSGELEIEKGITIESKVTSLMYGDHLINIVDTPGHQDFGGEVERVLSMVDGVLLLVCATEGTMRQTKYVLEKASSHGLKPIVIINKVDRPSARIEEVEEEILELFFDLNVKEEYLDYKTFYSSAKLFASFETQDEVNEFVKSNKGKTADESTVDPTSELGMGKILNYLIDQIESPKLIGNQEDKPKMLISQIEHDQLFGKIIRGKLESGKVSLGDTLASYNSNKKLVEKSKIHKIFKSNGLYREELTEAYPGDIISLAGFGKTGITDTISTDKDPFVIQSPVIDRPMVCVEVMPNNSPLSGKTEGAKLGFNDIKARIQKETERDLALNMKVEGSSKILLFGRGELHIGVILEKMRREGYELMVSCPKITMKMENGEKMEPIETLSIECELKHVSLILDMLMARQANIQDQVTVEDSELQRIIADIPTRGLIGLKLILQGETGNSISMEHSFLGWEEHRGEIEKKQKNSLIASHDGSATAYGIHGLEKFGIMFVKPTQKIYMGQIIGISNEKEHVINVCKEKRMTNIRSAGNDENIKLNSIKIFTIEEAISFIGDDDYVEITRDLIRLRKRELNADTRKSMKRRKLVDNDLYID
jgi:GTP-binding protein